MRTLDFIVDKQKLSKHGDFSNIVKGTKNYLKCKFTFNNDDWDNCELITVFELNNSEYAVKLDNDKTCMVPNELTNSNCFKVKMVGIRNDNNYIVTTNRVLITQEV